MHFTQEDYKKIENWFNSRSVKDSDFQDATSLNGKEFVTIIQNGHNRKINIKVLVEQLLNLGIEDFINITNNYDAYNISIEEAIRLIPDRARHEGQVITFLNTEGKWEIYQFIGNMSQWNNINLWHNPFDWEKLIIDSILPDEEDITKSLPDTNGNAYLSLKDKKYEPTKYSGLGKKILRKRIVEVKDPIYGIKEKNLLLQADFCEENTIYEIRYNFDLDGKKITIPSNCILDFQGGHISNGTIVLNNTNILPNGCVISNFISADVQGSYIKGQCIYDDTTNKPIWWNGSSWTDSLGNNI